MFSVLMACYVKDSPAYLSQALDSILSQTLRPEEVILVCDGPLTESLYEVIADFEEQATDRSILLKTVKLESNEGLGKALKIGVDSCSQPYIVRMDADDISVPGRLLELSCYIDENPEFDVVGAFIEEFVKVPGDLGVSRVVPCEPRSVSLRARYRNPVNHVTACIRRSTLTEIGNYEPVLWFEDYFLWLKLLRAGCIIVNIPRTHVYVRTDGFTTRRSGLSYMKAEFNFVRLVINRDYLSLFEGVRLYIPRLFLRLAPAFVSRILYKSLRTVITK